jgi:regulator of sigma E protease
VITPQHFTIIPILLVLIVTHELGHFFVARMAGVVVEEFAIGFPPRLFSRVVGGVRYSLNLLPFGAYVRLLGEEDPTAPGSFASQPKLPRALILAAGSAVNFIVGVLAFALAYGTGWPDPSNIEIRVADVVPGSPAASAGLLPGDQLRSVAGQPLKTTTQIAEYIRSNPGQPVPLTIARDNAERTIPVPPRTNPPEGQGALGVRLDLRALPSQHDPISSLSFGLRQTVGVIGLTLTAPALAFRGELPMEAVRPIGLPGMSQLAAEATTAVSESGWFFPILVLAAVFSAGLSVANMLPLPALDGGRLLFIAIEAIRGRPVPREVEGVIHTAGLVALVTLMVMISFNDVIRPVPAIDWGLR